MFALLFVCVLACVLVCDFGHWVCLIGNVFSCLFLLVVSLRVCSVVRLCVWLFVACLCD